MEYTLLFLWCLCLTILLEAVLLVLLIRRFPRYYPAFPLEKLIFTGIFCSALTLPYVWFVFPELYLPWGWYALLSESFAVVVETGVMARLLPLPLRKAFVLSLLCNGIAFGIGLMGSWVF